MTKIYLRNDYQKQYCERITAEIIAAIGDIISDDASDEDFLAAQSMVYAIIRREYVEIDMQKKEKTN